MPNDKTDPDLYPVDDVLPEGREEPGIVYTSATEYRGFPVSPNGTVLGVNLPEGSPLENKPRELSPEQMAKSREIIDLLMKAGGPGARPVRPIAEPKSPPARSIPEREAEPTAPDAPQALRPASRRIEPGARASAHLSTWWRRQTRNRQVGLVCLAFGVVAALVGVLLLAPPAATRSNLAQPSPPHEQVVSESVPTSPSTPPLPPALSPEPSAPELVTSAKTPTATLRSRPHSTVQPSASSSARARGASSTPTSIQDDDRVFTHFDRQDP